VSFQQLVECATHGQTRASYVCHHLLQSRQDGSMRPVNWVRDEDEHVNAWCDECEEYLQSHGAEWNDKTESFAKIRMICENCFETLKATNPTKELT